MFAVKIPNAVYFMKTNQIFSNGPIIYDKIIHYCQVNAKLMLKLSINDQLEKNVRKVPNH